MLTQEVRQQSRPGGEQPARERAGLPRRPDVGRTRAQLRESVQSNKGWLTMALGWFSIGLGLAQLLVPGGIARLIGIKDNRDNRRLVRMVGVRELASAAGIFGQRRPVASLWGRVAGDAMDLSILRRTLGARRREHQRAATALAVVAGVTALDLIGSAWLARRSARTQGMPADNAIRMSRAITVNRPVEEVYRFWRDFRNLPRFMEHLQTVQELGERRSHWRTRAPLGTSVEWDAEITAEEPDRLIAWRSLPGADVDNTGAVRFAPAPGGRGTEVRVEMEYSPPGGVVGKTLAALFGESPEQQVYDALRSFKQIMETGEVLYSEATIHGHPHPGQPPADIPQTQGDRS